MVLLKMLMEITLPKMGELLVMMTIMIPPSKREVPLAESLRRREKVLLPKFRLETAALHPESTLHIFFLSQNDLYTRRWAPEVSLGEHNPPGRAWAPWRAQVGCAHLVGPPLVLIGSNIPHVFHKKSSEVSAHLELCRIGSLT